MRQRVGGGADFTLAALLGACSPSNVFICVSPSSLQTKTPVSEIHDRNDSLILQMMTVHGYAMLYGCRRNCEDLNSFLCVEIGRRIVGLLYNLAWAR